MRDNYEKNREITERYTKQSLDKYLQNERTRSVINLEMSEYNYIINIAISILETKFPEIGPGYGGGGFVQAVVDNDLMSTFANADDINAQFIKFYCTLMYNFSPYSLGGYEIKETV